MSDDRDQYNWAYRAYAKLVIKVWMHDHGYHSKHDDSIETLLSNIEQKAYENGRKYQIAYNQAASP